MRNASVYRWRSVICICVTMSVSCQQRTPSQPDNSHVGPAKTATRQKHFPNHFLSQTDIELVRRLNLGLKWRGVITLSVNPPSLFEDWERWDYRYDSPSENLQAAKFRIDSIPIFSFDDDQHAVVAIEQLSTLSIPFGVDLQGLSVDAKLFGHLRQCKGLRHILLGNRWFNQRALSFDATLSGLGDLQQVTSLDLCDAPIQDAALLQVGKLRSLQYLDLRLVKNLTESGFASLAPLQQLEYLNLYNGSTGPGIVKEVGRLSRLRSLTIEITGVPNEAMQPLSNLSMLIKLVLHGVGNVDNFANQLSGLNRLQYLGLSGPSTTATGIVQLKDLKDLRCILAPTMIKSEYESVAENRMLHLMYQSGFRGQNGRKVHAASEVEVVCFDGSVPDHQYESFVRYTNAKRAEVILNSMPDAVLAVLAQFPKLEKISFGPQMQLTPESVRSMGVLKQLKELRFYDHATAPPPPLMNLFHETLPNCELRIDWFQ